MHTSYLNFKKSQKKDIANKKIEEEQEALWALSLSEALSLRHIDIYKKCFESYRQVLRLPPEKIHSIGLVKLGKNFEGQDNLLKKLDKVKSQCKKLGIETITLLDKDYPLGLKEIFQPPLVLYYRGHFQKYYPQKKGSYLSIVGTRRSDVLAETVTFNLARNFSALGGHIISGMALGIDTQAHLGALSGIKGIGQARSQLTPSAKTGSAGTTAVLGCGVEIPYPWGNRKLYKQIIDYGGAVISEYPPETPPLPYNFPNRNRIISGLSEGVLITQAPLKSGALITVDFALDQGRAIYAYDYKEDVNGEVPERNAGNYKLIQEGARAITSLADLFDNQFSFLKKKMDQSEAPEKPENIQGIQKIYQELREGPKTLTQLSQALKQETKEISPLLLEGIINGQIKEMPGKKYFLV